MKDYLLKILLSIPITLFLIALAGTALSGFSLLVYGDAGAIPILLVSGSIVLVSILSLVFSARCRDLVSKGYVGGVFIFPWWG